MRVPISTTFKPASAAACSVMRSILAGSLPPGRQRCQTRRDARPPEDRMIGDPRYGEIREGVRALCSEFPAAYFREVDARRGYPEEFVTALTKAGWLAALIPQEYGGS